MAKWIVSLENRDHSVEAKEVGFPGSPDWVVFYGPGSEIVAAFPKHSVTAVVPAPDSK